MRVIRQFIVQGLMILVLVACAAGDRTPTPETESVATADAEVASAISAEPTTEPAEVLEATTTVESPGTPSASADDSRAETPPLTLAKQDPIIEAGDGGAWSRSLHNSGAVIFHNGQFHMFRNGYPALPGNAVIGYATSPDGVHWNHYEDNPVMRTEDVPYAPQMIMASSVHVESDGKWVMYFLIWDTQQVPGAIGRATASSPTGPWIPDAEPVLLPGGEGAWDSAQVTQPIVLFDEAAKNYLMYYTGVDERNVERIGLATSQDGINWTKYKDPSADSGPTTESDPILEPGSSGEWDEAGAARGRVVRSPDGYVMIYRTPAVGLGFTYGLAFSADGIQWTKYEDNPILKRDDIPNARGLFYPTFVYHDGDYYFYIEAYSGSSSIYLLKGQVPLVAPESSDRPDVSGVTNLELFDRSNLGSAADVEVRFDIAPDGTRYQEHRVALVKAEGAAEFEEDPAGSLLPGRFAVPEQSGESVRFRLPAGLVDSGGEAIVEGRAYVAYVLSVANDGDVLSGPSAEITLANETTTWTLVPELPSATGGLAVDDQGNIYAANIGLAPSRNGSEIYRISPQGEFQLWVEGQGLFGASGNAFDGEGNLMQSSLRAGKIHQITPDGVVTEFARDGINSPVGITIAADGTMFVANCGSNTIQRLTPSGESAAFAASPLFGCPNGITMDASGNLYVANFSNGNVVKVTPSGEATHFVEVPGHNNGHIFYHNGLLYVVSRGGHQIYTLTLDGDLAVLAGTGERGHDDGLAMEAMFSLPNDIVASPDGSRLYVNEALATSGGANLPSAIRVIELARID
jgi:predicted GH43/DUF377 family glycosyl hydrolase